MIAQCCYAYRINTADTKKKIEIKTEISKQNKADQNEMVIYTVEFVYGHYDVNLEQEKFRNLKLAIDEVFNAARAFLLSK